MSELCDLSAVELRRLIGRKKVSPLELLDSCLRRIRATDGAINVMTKQLGHVIQRHTIVGTQTANASIFRAGENVVSLIKDAGRVTPTQQANGRLAFVVDAGRAIGYDRASGGPTAFYTVITDAGRNLITAFPGRPGM